MWVDLDPHVTAYGPAIGLQRILKTNDVNRIDLTHIIMAHVAASGPQTSILELFR